MHARQATKADAGEVVRLAGVMFDSMGQSLEAPGWPAAAEQEFVDRLGSDVMAFVVDDPDRAGHLVCSAAASISRRLPRPGDAGFAVGYVQWVATEPAVRGQGLARMVMTGLIEWLRERGASSVELHATHMAEQLYRSLGFSDSGPRALRIRQLSQWSGGSPADGTGTPR